MSSRRLLTSSALDVSGTGACTKPPPPATRSAAAAPPPPPPPPPPVGGGVVCCDYEVAHGQSHTLGVVTGEDVAEVTRRDRDQLTKIALALTMGRVDIKKYIKISLPPTLLFCIA